MKTELLKVAIRYNAIAIPKQWLGELSDTKINETTSVLLANCTQLGFTFSEDLLNQINKVSPKNKMEILSILKEITGVNKNWTPLVKQWNVPTGESVMDHVITFFSNVFKSKNGTTLSCGHFIPINTFPLERYNGCPYCRTPFELDKLDYKASDNKLKVLQLWTASDFEKLLIDLLASPVALDATQIESLTILLQNFELPMKPNITIKETLMVLIDALVAQGKENVAGGLFKTPNAFV